MCEARDDVVSDIDASIAKLDAKENDLNERQEALDAKKVLDQYHANPDAGDSDLIEVNAGGTIVAARRSTLTQIKGTRFEALFSGRWDKNLQRDRQGRIFLDVSPVAFQAIVDYLTELAISSAEDPLSPPCVDGENDHILESYLKLFGLRATNMPESNIIKTAKEAECLNDWLREDGSDGQLELLHRGSRDGLTSDAFHSNCDYKGCTLTVIETIDGYVLGGYSNKPWSCSDGYKNANKAFVFVLSGSDVSSPCKMKLNDEQDDCAVYHAAVYGPCFGLDHNLKVYGSKVSVEESSGIISPTYAPWPAGQLSKNDASFTIKEIEVFQVSNTSGEKTLDLAKGMADATRELPQAEQVTRFSKEINEALNAKQDCLLQVELDLLRLETVFEDERKFIDAFAIGDEKDLIVLNVNGTTMATHRATLQTVEDSVLARQFDDSKWTEQGIGPRVKTWTPDDVASWAENIDGIPADVGGTLNENDITGPELLALNMELLLLLEKLCVKRPGTLALVLKEIVLLKQANEDVVTLIEHSPYCFGKIVDFLRLKRLHSLGLTGKPALPKVCDGHKSSFEKVVRYYFPGDSANMLLGELRLR